MSAVENENQEKIKIDLWFLGMVDQSLTPMPFTLEKFLVYVKDNPRKFMNYCSVVIDENGLIYENIWGHQDTARRVIHLSKYEFDDAYNNYRLLPVEYMCSRYSIILVDYASQIGAKESILTPECRKSYDALVDHGIILPKIEYLAENK